MRGPTTVETRFPCPQCRGTGHSGNLHDETCSGCDGSRRLTITLTHEQKERYNTDAHYHGAADMLARLLAERGFTLDDLKGLLDVAAVLCAERTRDKPWPIAPVPYDEADRKMRDLEATMAHAAGVYVLPPDAVTGQFWPRTRVLPATAHIDPNYDPSAHAKDEARRREIARGMQNDPAKAFIDTDKEWP